MKSVLHLDVSSLKINHESFLHLLIIFMTQFSPGFFRSLLSSCYDAGFYSQIKNISLKRSFGFLFLFSILVSIVSFLLLLSYFSREEDISQNFLDVYDSHVPAFEVMIRENTLEIPSPITLYFQVDQHRNVSLETSSSSSSFFLLQADTSVTLSEFSPPTLSGIFILKDALVFSTGIQKSVVEYESLNLPLEASFSKESLRPLLEQRLPEIIDWAKSVTLQLGTALVFFYTLISSLALALFTSLFGILILLIRQKPLEYSFLIKLSFYAMVPALLILLLTHLFSISVAFLPFIVYVCFYYYGLMVYERR